MHGKRSSLLQSTLVLHNSTIETYLKAAKLTGTQRESCVLMQKFLYQAFLMMQQLDRLHKKVSHHDSFAQTGLQECHHDTQSMLEALLNGELIPPYSEKVEHYRANIKALQLQELQQSQPNFAALLDYSSYLYHQTQLWRIFTEMSQQYRQLQGGG
jgi:hypothetical protein